MRGRPQRLAGGLCVVLALAWVTLCVAGAFARGFGPWTGKVELVALINSHGPVLRAGRTVWAVVKPVSYRTHAGDVLTLPAGMTTDLASIPALASPVLPPDGPWVQIAVFHDLLYQTQGSGTWRGHDGTSDAQRHLDEQ